MRKTLMLSLARLSLAKLSLARLSLAGAVIIGGVAAGVAIGRPGLAEAQTDSTTTSLESTREDWAGDWLSQTLQPLVDDGTITAGQSQAVTDALVAAAPWHHGSGDNRGLGSGDNPGRGHGPGFRTGLGLATVADAIGITSDDLADALALGQTIAKVAEANGVEPQAVVDAVVAEIQAHLSDEVAEGELTQEEADAKLAEAEAKITEMINKALDGWFGHHGAEDDPADA